MSKIEWCDMVWNPVWGCNTGCEYCYARKMAKRFSYRMAEKEDKYRRNPYYTPSEICMELDHWLYNFKPTWLESNFQRKFPKKPKQIFVNSMSDIHWWEPEWMERVLERIKEYPQHTFMFLTKFPEIYEKYNFPLNCWLGVTVTHNKNVTSIKIHEYEFDWYMKNRVLNSDHTHFISIEPILEKFELTYLKWFDWVIVGAETGNRKGKVLPHWEWVEEIYKYCHLNKIPLFIKNNIYKHLTCFPKMYQFPEDR